jgi:hypothetical protein
MRTQLTNVRANSIRPLFAAILALAITFTLSCSGGDDPPNGGGDTPSVLNPSDLPKQAYIVVEDDDGNIIKKDEYKDGSNITLRIYVDEYSDIYENETAGKIQNGQVLLDLPKNIESKYLEKFDSCDKDDKECNVSIIPENLTSFMTRIFYVNIGKSDCLLRPVLTKSGDNNYYGRVFFHYVSQSGKITGTSCYNYDGATCLGYDNYDWNFSEGWNVNYRYTINRNVDNYTRNYTSDISKTGGKFEWYIICEDT